MSTMSVRVRYRPLRIGWCVASDDFDGLRRALRLTHTLWGGQFNPVLPIDDSPAAEALVENFRLDALYPASDDPTVGRFIARFRHLQWPLFWDKLFIDTYYGKSATLLDITHAIRWITNELSHGAPPSDWVPTLYKWAAGDPLGDVLLAMCGDVPTEHEVGVDYHRLLEEGLGAIPVEVAPDQPLPHVVTDYPTLSFLTTCGLSRDRPSDCTTPAVYVGDCRSFADIVNFWNLRAADWSVSFYDPGYSERLGPSWEGFWKPLTLPPHLRRPWQYPGHTRSIQVCCRSSGAADALPSPTLQLFEAPLGKGFVSRLSPPPPIARFDEQFALGVLESRRELPSMTFQLPQKPFSGEAELGEQRVVISVRIVGDLPEEAGHTFWTPHLPILNEYYGQACRFASADSVRVEPDGLSIVERIDTDAATLFALRRRQLITKVFEVYGIQATCSDAGLVTDRLIRQMGGLLDCRIFKIAGVRELISKYGPDKSFTRSGAVQVIGQMDPATGKPNFDQYARLFYGPRPSGEYKPEDAFADLLDRGVFRAGLQLRCRSCSLEFWIVIDGLRTEVECEYCGHKFNLTPQLKDRDWRYRRSGLFGRDDHQAGGIPVSLVLQKLAQRTVGGPVYDTAMNLRPAGARIPNCETDFVVLRSDHHNRPQLIIGECKTADEITQQDVDNLTAVARVFANTPIRVFVVFAKLSRFTEVEVGRLKGPRESGFADIILLSERELEDDSTYRWAQEALGLNLLGYDPESLVRGTEVIYFGGGGPQ